MSDSPHSERPAAGWRIEDVISDVPMWIGAAMVVAMLIHVCIDIAFKMFLHSPIPGTLELVSYYYMVAVVFLPLAFVQKIRGHVIVEVFTAWLPPRVIAWVDRGAQLVSAIYVGGIGWWGMNEAIRATKRGEFIQVIDFDLPVWVTRWVVAISAGLMMVVILIQLYRDIRGKACEQADPSLTQRNENT